MTYEGQGQHVCISFMLNLLRDQRSLQTLEDPRCRLAIPLGGNRTIFHCPAINRAREE